MKAAGVTGVVNVQTDHDIVKRMINMDVMRRLYNEAGIELRHVPIEDFNGDSLAGISFILVILTECPRTAWSRP